jgi:flagellar motor protein MotB
MRHLAITVAGYPAGQTEFEPMFASAELVERQQLLGVVQRIADSIVEPETGRFTSIVVVGHSDRQDNPTMGCDEKRASEIAAARARGTSAWEWVTGRVSERLAVAGVEADEWWETASSVGWSLVFAAAGMLEHDPPASEEERLLNRRVVFVVGTLDPA